MEIGGDRTLAWKPGGVLGGGGRSVATGSRSHRAPSALAGSASAGMQTSAVTPSAETLRTWEMSGDERR